MSIEYYNQAVLIMSAIVPHNPTLKQNVGNVIFPFVSRLIGSEKAPKITGMLVDLNIDDLRKQLLSFDFFEGNIRKALEMLEKSLNAQKTAGSSE